MKILFIVFVALFLMGFINGAYSYCLDTWVDHISEDGKIITLNNNTVWEVGSADAEESSDWLPSDDIITCGDILRNDDWEEHVTAIRLDNK